ncbi:wax ester/triacylglycerol synthase family O-acyltransferase [Mycolicibacterium brumae]|uniref:Diacylglycerol O-acyltransferase n=1 Tax=Mycolicibacterium brumae TaxID=85968 RepID=A0A2G5PB41_9MYCO|nr:wax ester/triacylglycerol synthase family O-acyltransferase [Mycolicibacterium brumae]MCV7193312.1 wax ester/triacylglycerol synthase family O-acyltransferase [Mycolicibacterium brumae]PIB75589.1 wax ester/triacylglycerol synthase family O-acyltransferase [Mycolicibacterium brumae]RWA21043.1 hypothetical protein MBRU_15155 [Mycolicibacterium brumae DSM 44177]UWW09969.1 wax ester/triacylglycerol synthase family O-acyltransferase [Mycolicibacterium brumae]
MEQLSVLDAGFLQLEDTDPNVSLAIGSVTILDGPLPDFDELAATIAERLVSAPRLRQVVRTHTLDIEAPEWVDAPELDMGRHLRRAALPSPGDDGELCALIAEIMERRLDRDYPLWECWVIEGLAGGRWALLTKVHHCLADGVSAAAMMAGFNDGGNATSFAGHLTAGGQHQHDHDHDHAAPGIGLNPLDWGKAALDLAAGAAHLAVQSARGTAEIVTGILRPAPESTLNGPVGALRRYGVGRASITEIKAIAKAFDASFNDVALAAVTNGYRQVLLHRGETPRRDSLRTLIPVSVRDTTALHTPDNRVSLMLPLLPVDQATPVEQLRTLRLRMRRSKSSGQRQAGAGIVGMANRLAPFALTAWAVRAASLLPQRNVCGLATNVPGVSEPARILGRPVLEVWPIPPLALRLRVGVAMLSYVDRLSFGITADYDSTPDMKVMVDGIESALAELSAQAPVS